MSDPLKTRLQLTLDLSKSLLDLHSKGFISRDVKPSNCLITSDFHLKLADFGLATNFQILTNFSTKVATLPYKAPELCCNKSNYGAEIDIYSAGCTIFEIFTGNILIKAENEF